MMSGLAVGMAAIMGAAPVYAATGEDAAVSKEETVYVNANADGSEDQITVSNWLKNAGTEKNLKCSAFSSRRAPLRYVPFVALLSFR